MLHVTVTREADKSQHLQVSLQVVLTRVGG